MLYTYYCDKCDIEFEDNQNMSDPIFLIRHTVTCPKCGAKYGWGVRKA